jgi:hypothetical protein
VGEGLLAAIPSSPIPRELQRRLLIRSVNPPPPEAAKEKEGEVAAPERKEMEERTESNGSLNPPLLASSRMVWPVVGGEERKGVGVGSSGEGNRGFGHFWLQCRGWARHFHECSVYRSIQNGRR